MDNNDFLENGNLDQLLQKIVNDKFHNIEFIDVDGKTMNSKEYEEYLFGKFVESTEMVMSKEILSYSQEQNPYYDDLIAFRKREITNCLSKTISLLKNRILKSPEIGKYLASKSGIMQEGKRVYSGMGITQYALVRIHEVIVQIAGEILLLIESGFSEGAEARWRTLNEYSIIACVLFVENDVDLSARYI